MPIKALFEKIIANDTNIVRKAWKSESPSMLKKITRRMSLASSTSSKESPSKSKLVLFPEKMLQEFVTLLNLQLTTNIHVPPIKWTSIQGQQSLKSFLSTYCNDIIDKNLDVAVLIAAISFVEAHQTSEPHQLMMLIQIKDTFVFSQENNDELETLLAQTYKGLKNIFSSSPNSKKSKNLLTPKEKEPVSIARQVENLYLEQISANGKIGDSDDEGEEEEEEEEESQRISMGHPNAAVTALIDANEAEDEDEDEDEAEDEDENADANKNSNSARDISFAEDINLLDIISPTNDNHNLDPRILNDLFNDTNAIANLSDSDSSIDTEEKKTDESFQPNTINSSANVSSSTQNDTLTLQTQSIVLNEQEIEQEQMLASVFATKITELLKNYYAPNTSTQEKNNKVLTIINDILLLADHQNLRVRAPNAKNLLVFFKDKQSGKSQDPLKDTYLHLHTFLKAIIAATTTRGTSEAAKKEIHLIKAKARATLEQLKTLRKNGTYQAEFTNLHQQRMQRKPARSLLQELVPYNELQTYYASAYANSSDEKLDAKLHFEGVAVDELERLLEKNENFTIEEQYLIVKAILDFKAKNEKTPFYKALSSLSEPDDKCTLLYRKILPYLPKPLSQPSKQQVFLKKWLDREAPKANKFIRSSPNTSNLPAAVQSPSNAFLACSPLNISVYDDGETSRSSESDHSATTDFWTALNTSVNSNSSSQNLSDHTSASSNTASQALTEEQRKSLFTSFDETCHGYIAKNKSTTHMVALLEKAFKEMDKLFDENKPAASLFSMYPSKDKKPRGFEAFKNLIKPKNGIPPYAFALYCVYLRKRGNCTFYEKAFIREYIQFLFTDADSQERALNKIEVPDKNGHARLADYIAPINSPASETSAMNLIADFWLQELSSLESGEGLTQAAITQQQSWFPKQGKNFRANLMQTTKGNAAIEVRLLELPDKLTTPSKQNSWF